MKNLKRVAVLLAGVVGAGGGGSLLAVGCGGDDTVVATDSGSDRTVVPDAMPDTSPLPDGPDEVDAADAGPADVTAVDAETGVADSGSDVVVIPDSGDLTTFSTQVTTVYCQRLGECCFGADAAAFDLAHCISSTTGSGGIKLLERHAAALSVPGPDGGRANNPNVQYDPDAGSQCLNAARNYSCTLTSAQSLQIRDACYAALKGTAPASAPCRDSIECAQGRCVPNPDGGVGSCGFLANTGDPCNSTDQCAYRGTAAPPSYCTIAASQTDGGVCQPSRALAASCGDAFDYEAQCLSGICAGVGVCSGSVVENSAGTCRFFTRDGG